METVGIDVGYSFTKTSTGFMFPSRITTAEPMLGHPHTLRYQDTVYFIGTGNVTVSLNKTDETITHILLLYALCASAEGDKCNLVTGLPIGQYRAQKSILQAVLKKKLAHNRTEINGQERTISVEEISIYPQGLLPISGDYVSVDIGGCTVDIAYIAGNEVAHAKTLFQGMRSLHSKIMDAVNSKYESRLPDDYAHRILTEGLIVQGKQEDISFLFPIYQEHVESIVEQVKEFCPKNITQVYITGGGAEILFDSIKKRLPAQLVDNGQFSNADMFKLWGEDLWG